MKRLLVGLVVLLLPTIVSAQACYVSWERPASERTVGYHIYKADSSEAVMTMPQINAVEIDTYQVSGDDNKAEATCESLGLKHGDWFTITASIDGRQGPKNQPLNVMIEQVTAIFQCVYMKDGNGQMWGEPMCTPSTVQQMP